MKNQVTLKRILVVLAVILLTACLLVACNEKNNKPDNKPFGTTADQSNENTTEPSDITDSQQQTTATGSNAETDTESSDDTSEQQSSSDVQQTKPATEQTTESTAEQTTEPDAELTTEPVTESAEQTTEVKTESVEQTTTQTETEEETLPPNEDEYFVYELLSDGTYKIKSLKDKYLTEIDIPTEFRGKPVTEIGSAAFQYCDLKSVYIPETIVKIGKSAFAQSDVESVVFAEQSPVTVLPEYAFSLCNKLTEIVLPRGLTVIQSNALRNCEKLQNVELPETVVQLHNLSFDYENLVDSEPVGDLIYWQGWLVQATNYSITEADIREGTVGIADAVFSFKSKLESVTLPTSLRCVGASAFQYTVITEIDIPDNVEFIRESAFCGCDSLVSVRFGEQSKLKFIGSEAFSGLDKLAEITLPASLEYVDTYAFASGKVLKEVTFKSTHLELAHGVFDYSQALTTVNFAQSTEGELIIGDYVFSSCRAIESIVLPDNLVSIGNYAFHSCTAITEIDLPQSLNSIGERAFSYCEALRAVTFADSTRIDYWGESCFSDATNLTEVIFGDNCYIESIPKRTFAYLTSLKTVTFGEGTVVKSIGEYAFNKCSSLENFVLPTSVESIEKWAFYECKSLSEITFGKELHTIGEYAFTDCSSLKAVNFAENGALEVIGRNAFSDTGIVSLVIPEGITVIQSSAFFSCDDLSEVTLPSTLVQIYGSAFSLCKSLATVYNGSSLELKIGDRSHGEIAYYATEIIPIE